MEWVKGEIEAVIIKKLTKHLDERGFLAETFRMDELPENLQPVMSYVSYTEPGIILDDEIHRMFYVPPGFAHGFLILSETADFHLLDFCFTKKRL